MFNNIQTFDTKEAAETAVADEKMWSKYYVKDTLKGRRVKYRCNAVQYRGKQCPAGIYLSFHAENETVSLFRCESEHVHDSEGQNVSGSLSVAVQKVITDCFKQNMKPKAMKYVVASKGLGVIQHSRLTSFLRKLRLEKYGNVMNFASLYSWLRTNSTVPESDTEAFVVSFEMDENDENAARFRSVHLSVYLLMPFYHGESNVIVTQILIQLL